MGKTSYGYSLRLARLNEAALVSSLGVQLGRTCIEHNVPVVAVAEHLGVSRQTVYNWFIGRSIPMKSTEHKINRFILALSR